MVKRIVNLSSLKNAKRLPRKTGNNRTVSNFSSLSVPRSVSYASTVGTSVSRRGTRNSGFDGNRSLGPYVSAPIARGIKAGPMGRPRISKLPNGPMVICHKEYVNEVIASINFAATGYNVNPGLSSTFPWLSGVASNFEKYKFRYCHFRFEPEASTTTAGSIMMSVDLNALDLLPTSKQEVMTVKDAVRSPTWSNCMTTIPEIVKELFVRTSTPPPNSDLKTYDAGLLTVARQGQPTASVAIGELYVEYCVELHVPTFTSSALTATLINSVATSTTNAFGVNAASMNFGGSLQVGGDPNGNILRLPCSPGDCFLFTINAAPLTASGITSYTLQTTVSGSVITLLGTYSTTFSTSGATMIIAFQATTTIVFGAAIGADLPGLSGVLVSLLTAGSATYPIGALSCTISPWQKNLIFP